MFKCTGISSARLFIAVFLMANLSAVSIFYYGLQEDYKELKVISSRALATEERLLTRNIAAPQPQRVGPTITLVDLYRERGLDIHLDSTTSKRIAEVERQISHKILRTDVVSCRRRGANFSALPDTFCPGSAEGYVYYNGFSQTRILCQTYIPPKDFVVLSEECHEPSKLYGQKMPAVVIEAASDPQLDHMKEQPCDVSCFRMAPDRVYNRLKIRDTPFRFLQSMESERHNAHLKIEPLSWRVNDFKSNTRFQSEIPMPYYSQHDYNLLSPSVSFSEAIPAALYLARNCYGKNGREDMVSEISKTFRVDALSNCLRNRSPPSGVDMSNKTDVMSRYMFYLAFENSNVDDYITEKLWGALEAGTLPVYYGAPNVLDFAPPNSIIFANSFNNMTELALYLAKVSTNVTLYQSYHAWRSQPLPTAFVERHRMAEIHPTCRMCRWAQARRLGLRWNHESQSIEPSEIDRAACLSKRDGTLQLPVGESFGVLNHTIATAAASTMATDTCDYREPDHNNISIGGGLIRTLEQHDQIIDLTLQRESFQFADAAGGDIRVWRFRIPSSLTGPSPISQGQLWFQNATSRITFLAYPPEMVDWTFDQSTGNSLEIRLPPTNTEYRLTIRVVVEDLDTFHEGAGNVESYFGFLMKQDLWNPIETFRLG